MKTPLATFLLTLAALLPGRSAGDTVYESVTPTASAAIRWEGRHGETIEAKRIGGPLSIRLEQCTGITIVACELDSIELLECKDVTIRNCWIHDSARVAVEMGGCTRVTVEGCRIENVVSGVYSAEGQGIRVLGNFVRNVKGPFPRGQLAQFDKVTGAGNVVRDNYAINERGKSFPEDVINIYQSTGTADSPILIENNYLTGDPAAGSADKSENGSGIMLGDGGGAHILCRKNVILSAGQVGLGVAGGTFIRVEDNRILGRKSNVANNGLYVWNQSKLPSHHVTLIRNRVNWVNKDGEDNSWWDGGGVQQLVQSENRFADATLPEAIPAPPSRAPLPPKPWAGKDTNGRAVVRLPWKVE